MKPIIELDFGQRFQALPAACFRQVNPSPLPDPCWVAVNHDLARQLGIAIQATDEDPALQLFAGNRMLPGMTPLAARYSGHQFGVYVPQLGDGRALLLGDLPWGDERAELQLKGAGKTPFSRMGDGRAVLRSSIREYLCSEAMYGLGIPTTRALCLIGSSEPVWRETRENAAVVTRVAQSFIRFGSFEVLYHQRQHEELRSLADFVIQHHYPACREAEQPYAALFCAVAQRTARLIAQWQSVGFCHGVMNSDNMSILGLTLDYGPFGFLDGFNVAHICNHSDDAGRYAYNQQPLVGQWNLQCLACALLPLVSEEVLVRMLADYRGQFESAWLELMRAKLGLVEEGAADAELITDLLQALHDNRADFTLFFRGLSELSASDPADRLAWLFTDTTRWFDWCVRYRQRLLAENRPDSARRQAMLRVNPKYILRNYLAEAAIALARDEHDFSEVERLAQCLSRPFDDQPAFAAYAALPPASAQDICLSCSS